MSKFTFACGLIIGFFLGGAVTMHLTKHKEVRTYPVIVSSKVVATIWFKNQLTIVLPTNGEDKESYWECIFHGNRYANVSSCVEFEMKEDK